MAWPQAPQPAPAPAAGSPPLGALVTAGAGLLTFFFSFVQVAKVEAFGGEAGWSVWTTDQVPGFFGIGTFIPLFALVAAAAALAAAFAKGLADKSLAGFTLGQIQLVAVAFAVLLWFGYLVNAVIGDTEPGLGLLLLFVGLAGLVAGTVLSMMEAKKAGAPAAPVGGEAFPAAPQQHWSQPAAPAQPQWQQPAPAPQQWEQPPAQPQWQQPQPDPQQWQQPAAPAPDPGQWQPAPAAPAPPAWDQTVVHGAPPAPGQWQQPPAPTADPGQWQPAAGSPTEPQPWEPAPAPPGPQPEPGPLDPQPGPPVDPQPEPAGGLFDPGTQVIPGPPPAPPADDANPQPGGPVGLPEPPPSNTP